MTKISFSPSKRLIGLSLLFAILTSCGGGGGSSDPGTTPNVSINAFVSKAPIDQASCSLLNASGTRITGPSTSNQGRVSFSIANSVTGMHVVECSGGVYIDEATQQSINAPLLRVATSNLTSTISITPLTEIAFRLAQADGDLSDIDTINQDIADELGLDGIDITTVLPTDLNTTTANSDQQGRYGTVLAIISQMVNDGVAANMSALLDAFQTDLQDNSLSTLLVGFNSAVDNLVLNTLINANVNPTLANTIKDNTGESGDGGENSTVTLSGKATYDHVPTQSTNGISLDYANTTQDAIRAATIELLDLNNNVLKTTTADNSGNYAFSVDPNQTVKIRVKAQLLKTGSPAWDVKVVDNTSNEALYSFSSNNVNTGTSDLTVNVNAPSGFTIGSGYTSTRVAAPFAIMDSIYSAILKVTSVDGSANFPPLQVNWSVNNQSLGGNQAIGNIGTSFYAQGKMFLLGKENADTDEYDGHVVIHEWGHYFEDKLSRSDTLGGSHSPNDRLDMRVAFSEGFGYALSGIVTSDPITVDTTGNLQADGFIIDVSNASVANAGWYSEDSLQNILYRLDQDPSIGFSNLYTVLTNGQKDTPAFTSVFSFITLLKSVVSGGNNAIDTITSSHNIDPISDIYGVNETNNAGNADVFPIYHQLTVGQTLSNVCTLTAFSIRNGSGLGTRRYIRFIATNTTHTFSVTTSSGNNTDPDITIFNTAPFARQAVFNSEIVGSESGSTSGFVIGREYLIDLREFNGNAQACFTINVN